MVRPRDGALGATPWKIWCFQKPSMKLGQPWATDPVALRNLYVNGLETVRGEGNKHGGLADDG